ISVDLPAPLSPRMQVTSPALTCNETSWSARTLPKYLETCSSSSRWGAAACCGALISPCPLGPPPDRRVEHHRGDEHDAFEEIDPVRVPPRRDDPDLGHTDDGGAECSPDDRSVPACQQAATDDGGDDELELSADALVALHAPEADCGHDPPEGCDGRGRHEEQNLRPRDRHADVARCHRVAPRAEDPVAEARAGEHPCGDDREAEPPER